MVGKRFWIVSVGSAIAAFTACTLNPQPLPPADPAGMEDAGRKGDAAAAQDPAPFSDAGFGGSLNDASSPNAADAGDASDADAEPDAGDGG